jgi:hypothetical protein
MKKNGTSAPLNSKAVENTGFRCAYLIFGDKIHILWLKDKTDVRPVKTDVRPVCWNKVKLSYMFNVLLSMCDVNLKESGYCVCSSSALGSMVRRLTSIVTNGLCQCRQCLNQHLGEPNKWLCYVVKGNVSLPQYEKNQLVVSQPCTDSLPEDLQFDEIKHPPRWAGTWPTNRVLGFSNTCTGMHQSYYNKTTQGISPLKNLNCLWYRDWLSHHMVLLSVPFF